MKISPHPRQSEGGSVIMAPRRLPGGQMNRREFLRTSTAAAGLFTTAPLWLCSSGEARPDCYRTGDKVDRAVSFLDQSLQRVILADQVHESTKVLYLLIIGGAYARKRPDKRGRLWCDDSSDDLAIHRTVYFNYADKGVTFVPVATPPVYSSAYGYRKDGLGVRGEDRGPERGRDPSL
jgi:hypothetical protein